MTKKKKFGKGRAEYFNLFQDFGDDQKLKMKYYLIKLIPSILV